MPQFVINLILVISGAAAALIGKELVDWFRRPRLIIDFEKGQNEYPLVHDYNNSIMGEINNSVRFVFFRLRVVNKGKTTAYDCETKLDMISNHPENNYRKLIHWSKYEPTIYKSLDKIYSPINLNRNDTETVDVLRLRYTIDNHNAQSMPNAYIETYSPGELFLWKDMDYYFKATIYASNATSKPFCFKLKWDGTIEGFNKALIKMKTISMK